MNILRRYIHRQLLENRTHSLLTICSLTIALALLCSFSTVLINAFESIAYSVVDVVGDYHVQLTRVEDELIDSLKIHGSVEKIVLVQDKNTYAFEQQSNSEKKQFHLLGFSLQAFQDLQIHLIDGRMPQNAHEILISEEALYQGKIQADLNQPFEFTCADGTNLSDYQVVGIMETPFFDYKTDSYSLITAYEDKASFSQMVFLTFKDNTNIRETVQRLEEHFGHLFDHLEVNTRLVSLGNIFDSAYFSGIWLFVIAFAVFLFLGINILLIRNSFKNSYANREKHLAILKIIGVTQRQCQRLILYEGFILLVVGLIIGILLGISLTFLFTFVLNHLLNDISVNSIQLENNHMLPCILTSCGFVIIVAFHSMIHSAKKVVYNPVASTLQTSEEVVVQDKPYLELNNKKTTIFSKMLIKNIRQNRSYYRQIVFSLIAVLSLFIFLNGSMGYLRDSQMFDIDEYNYDVEVMIQNDTYPTRFMTQLKQMEHQKSKVIRESLIVDVATLNCTSEYFNHIQNKEKTPIQLLVYSDQALESFVTQNRLLSSNEFFRLKNIDNPLGILVNQTYYSAQRRYTDIFETLTLHQISVGKQKLANSLNVIETDRLMSGCTYVGLPQVIVSQQVFDHLTQNLIFDTHHYEVFYQSADAKQLTHELSMLVTNEFVESVDIKNVVASSEKGKSMIMLIRVLCYGFILSLAIMGAFATCCIASTNFEYRKQEFALYRILGLRMKEIRLLILAEYLYYACLVFLASLICSTGLNAITYQRFVKELGIQFFIPLNSLIGAACSLIILGILVLAYSSHKIKRLSLSYGLKNEISLM